MASQVLLLALYLVSLPMAYWLAVDMQAGVNGLWVGFALGMAVTCLLYAFLYVHVDWQEVFRLNRERKQDRLERELMSNVNTPSSAQSRLERELGNLRDEEAGDENIETIKIQEF